MYHANVNINLMEEIATHINGGIMINYVLDPATCNCKNGKCLSSIMDDSVIICNEIIKEKFKQILTEIKQTVKHKISIFYLHF